MHILEARNLIGGEVNPVVKVLCGEEIKHTNIQKGTNNPFWDEVRTLKQVNVLVLVRPQRHVIPIPHPPLCHTLTHQVLYYNFKEHPDIVFDKVVEIKVFNAENIITTALIGTFKVTA